MPFGFQRTMLIFKMKQTPMKTRDKRRYTPISRHFRLSTIAMVLGLATLSGCATLGNTPKPAESAAKAATPPPPEPVSRPFDPETLYDLLVAELAGKRNRPEVALGKYLKQAHQSRDPAVAARATHIARFLNAHQASLDSAMLWSEIEPENQEAKHITASALIETGNIEKAIALTKDLLKDDPQLNVAFLMRGLQKANKEQSVVLSSKIKELTQKYPNNATLWFVRAALEQANRELEPALASFDKAIALKPDYTNAILAKARQLAASQRTDEAIALLREAIKNSPTNKTISLTYGQMLVKTKQFDDAQKEFTRIAEQHPQDPDLLLSLALISLQNKLYDTAKVHLNRLLELNRHNAEANFYLGRIASDEKDYATSIDYLSLVSHGPLYIQARVMLAALLIQEKKPEKSAAVLSALREEMPKQAANIYRAESELLADSKRYDDAVKLLDKALMEYPEDTQLRYNRAMYTNELGNFDGMVQDLRRIINQDPDNQPALNALGYAYADRNIRLKEAEKMIKKAYDMSPNEPAVTDSMGWIKYRLGDYESALTYLRRAYEQMPDQEVAAHLVEVLWESGAKDEARKLFKEAYKASPDSKLLKALKPRFDD